MTSQKQAMLYAMSAVLCWSTVATAFKLSLEYLSPLQLILVASLSSTVFLFGILLVQGRAKILFRVPKKDYIASSVFGLMNPCLYYFLLFYAYDLLPAQEAQALNYSWAIVMTILAVPLLGHRFSRFDAIAALICYFGVLLIATRGNILSLDFANIRGVFFAMASTVVWSLYWILNSKHRREPILGLFLNFALALPIIILVCMISGELSSLADNISWQGLVGGVYVGVFEMGLGFVFWLLAMRRAENTSKIANLIFISPFLSLVFINVFLDETILFSTLVGLALIISGLLVQSVFTVAKVKSDV